MKITLGSCLQLAICFILVGCGDPFSRPPLSKDAFIEHFLGSRIKPDQADFIMSNKHGGYAVVAKIKVNHEAGNEFIRKLPLDLPYDPNGENAAADQKWNEYRIRSTSEGAGAPAWLKFPYSRYMVKAVFRTDDDGEWAFYWDDIDDNLYLFAVGERTKTGLNGPIEKIERVTGPSLPFKLRP